ncbi:MAG: hypothetical protein DRR16_26360 [Candidatus Parabeggiatoa sp. nov. 3]|nr:MAG: hypothetical protein DRR00_28390 [Gammaproteobacteria bacterium]RKZ57660.1 MAG: hypothetical protein DRQ99_26595 [Gammaproteobacteria bacterium]RKZ79110.1 MAG: hypothetical protein DRR16_26360 [Gammaproteobacteria bacterium]
MNFRRAIFVVFVLALISGCSSIDNQILGHWHCENCEEEKNLLILEDNRIFRTPQNAQYEYDILEKGLMELDRVNPFFLLRWLREFFCIFVTCEQVIKYKLAKDGTLRLFWDGEEEIDIKVSLGENIVHKKPVGDSIKFINNVSIIAISNSDYHTGKYDVFFPVDAKKCLVDFKLTENWSFSSREIDKDKSPIRDKRGFKIDFGALNPNSVKIFKNYHNNTDYYARERGYQALTVRTTNGKKEISVLDSYGKTMASENELFFYTNDRKISRKIKEALKSAIIQCGGKDDLF